MERKEIKKQIQILHDQVHDLMNKIDTYPYHFDKHPHYQELFDTHDFLSREYVAKRYLDNIEAHLKDLQELKRWLMNVTV